VRVRHSPIVSLPYGPPVFYGVLLAIWLLDERRTRSRPARQGEVERDEGTKTGIRMWGFLGIVAAIAVAYAVPQATLPIPASVALFAGAGLQCAAYAVVEWTTRILGHLYRPIVAVQRDHRVIATGPYRLVRHPMYAAGLLTDLGICLALANAFSFAVLLPASAYAYARRIDAEERLLAEQLGDEYRDYVRSTKRLIPFVW
jgi:protein-S-isoprenylcysteine O-methyltransferase Ste14